MNTSTVSALPANQAFLSTLGVDATGRGEDDSSQANERLGCSVEEHLAWIASASEEEIRSWAQDWNQA